MHFVHFVDCTLFTARYVPYHIQFLVENAYFKNSLMLTLVVWGMAEGRVPHSPQQPALDS